MHYQVTIDDPLIAPGYKIYPGYGHRTFPGAPARHPLTAAMPRSV